jgi:hypothetical protein
MTTELVTDNFPNARPFGTEASWTRQREQPGQPGEPAALVGSQVYRAQCGAGATARCRG